MQSLNPHHDFGTSTVLAVVGPTAVGKSALAERIACAYDGEIVSADSMQVYRRMDIGTAKTPGSQRAVPYHCVDMVDPGEPFSAALYQRAARESIEAITVAGRLPVVVGGTGLYVRAALDAMEFPAGEQVANVRRETYERIARHEGPQALHDELARRDEVSARLIHPNNVRRVVRALEMADEGVSYAAQAAGFSDRRSVYAARFLGLSMAREELYRRIDLRVVDMVDNGLVAEVERLLAAGFREALTSQQAIGYKELVPVLEDGLDLETAVEQIQRASRRYAKRQLTWFRSDPRIQWIDVTGMSTAQAYDAAIETLDWKR